MRRPDTRDRVGIDCCGLIPERSTDMSQHGSSIGIGQKTELRHGASVLTPRQRCRSVAVQNPRCHDFGITEWHRRAGKRRV
jgi:hypothetical protein